MDQWTSDQISNLSQANQTVNAQISHQNEIVQTNLVTFPIILADSIVSRIRRSITTQYTTATIGTPGATIVHRDRKAISKK